MSWDDRRINLLKKLWAEGMTCSRIAMELGGVTRNAVISKVHRLRLPGRIANGFNPSRKVKVARVPRAQGKPAVPKMPKREGNAAFRELLKSLPAEPVKPVVDPPIPMAQRRTIETLEDHHCRWPIGDPQEADFHFCGASKVAGLSYCAAHAVRVYQSPAVKQPEGTSVRSGSLRTGVRGGEWYEAPKIKTTAGGASERDLEEV